MNQRNIKTYFLVEIILSIIATLFLFLFDFGGYYYNTSNVEHWGYIGFGTGIITSILIFIAGIGFFLVMLESFRIIKAKKIDKKSLKYSAKANIYGAFIPLIITLPSALVLIIANAKNDWWLDTAFYSTLAISLMIMALNYVMMKLE